MVGAAHLVIGLLFGFSAVVRDRHSAVGIIVFVLVLGAADAALLDVVSYRRRIQQAEVTAAPTDSTVDVEPLRRTLLRSLLLAAFSVALLGLLGLRGHQFMVPATLTVGFGGSQLLASRRIRSVERLHRAVLLRRIERPFSWGRGTYAFRPV